MIQRDKLCPRCAMGLPECQAPDENIKICDQCYRKAGFRFFSMKELREMKSGTIFDHKTYGKCIVKKSKKHNLKYVVFKNENKYDKVYFIYDGQEPWNEPMKLIFKA